MVCVVNYVVSCPLYSHRLKRLLTLLNLKLRIVNQQMWRLTQNYRCVTGLAHHVT